MKKATRELLKARPGANFVLVESFELTDTLANHFYQNAVKLAETNEADLLVVSGWLVGDFMGERGTAIIPHYWVKNDKTKKFYDPTPKQKDDKQNYEYVEDFDIFQYGNRESILPLPLKLNNNGKWQARNALGTGYIDLDKVDVQELYDLRNT